VPRPVVVDIAVQVSAEVGFEGYSVLLGEMTLETAAVDLETYAVLLESALEAVGVDLEWYSVLLVESTLEVVAVAAVGEVATAEHIDGAELPSCAVVEVREAAAESVELRTELDAECQFAASGAVTVDEIAVESRRRWHVERNADWNEEVIEIDEDSDTEVDSEPGAGWAAGWAVGHDVA
jgi:hypothetical protein